MWLSDAGMCSAAMPYNAIYSKEKSGWYALFVVENKRIHDSVTDYFQYAY